MKNKKILIVEDDSSLAYILKRLFEKRGYTVYTSENGKQALSIIKENPDFDVVITDIVMPEIDGMTLLKEIKRNFQWIEVIVMTGYGDIETAVTAMKEGAYDFITKPFEKDKMVELVNRIIKIKEIEKEVKGEIEEVEIIGEHPLFERIVSKSKVAARTDFPILIIGESGTGKEVLARFIHKNSDRKNNPFVPVNCSAIPSDLFEAELFGYRKGAFTGAVKDYEGVFGSANKGTVLLDEISEMPLNLQAKLLRVIETKKVKPLGCATEIDLDVRIIATTNLSLKELLSGKMRLDLYYRFPILIEIPPLRKRKTDIPILLDYFLSKYSKELGKEKPLINEDVIEVLMSYSFPGNVRELEHIAQRILAFSENKKIDAKEIREIIYSEKSEQELEKDKILKVLESVGGNKKKAAEILGISRATFYRKLKELGIE